MTVAGHVKIGESKSEMFNVCKERGRAVPLSKKTKLKVVNANVLPALIHGCETWSLSKQQESKVQPTHESPEKN